jgi:hypothetical protein
MESSPTQGTGVLALKRGGSAGVWIAESEHQRPPVHHQLI